MMVEHISQKFIKQLRCMANNSLALNEVSNRVFCR